MLVILSIIPPLAIVFAVNKYCGTERQYLKRFILIFLIGGFLVAEVAMQGGYFLTNGVEAVLGSGVLFVVFSNFITTALLEEGLKFLPLRWRYAKGDPFTNPLYAIAISVTISMGFAFWEQIYYTLDSTLTAIILRDIFAVPGHMAHAIFMGWFMYLAAKAASSGDEAGKKKNFRLAILVPTLTHGVYDVIVGMYRMSGSMLYFWMLFIFAPALIIYTVRLLKRVRKEEANADNSAANTAGDAAVSTAVSSGDKYITIDNDDTDNTDNDLPEVFYE